MSETVPMRRWDGRRVLITGGLGFIGSNLAIRLVELGAEVTAVDAMIPQYGGNLFNIEPIKDQIKVHFGNICDEHAMRWLVQDKDYVFHLAGQVSHILSLTNPYLDIEYNIKGSVVLMESMREHNPNGRVIFTGTRGQYGPAITLPVNEIAPTMPRGIYEISNLAAEKIIKVYNDTHGIASILLRLTNVYGPRAQMRNSNYGVVNWFVRLAIDNQEIQVFGDGKIIRDFLYVDDCVDAMIRCAECDQAVGEIINVGIDRPTDFLELVQTLIECAGTGSWRHAPFSPERAKQEPGHFYSDITKIRKLIGWSPTTSLQDGLNKTIEYYREYHDHYWDHQPSESLSRAA